MSLDDHHDVIMMPQSISQESCNYLWPRQQDQGGLWTFTVTSSQPALLILSQSHITKTLSYFYTRSLSQLDRTSAAKVREANFYTSLESFLSIAVRCPCQIIQLKIKPFLPASSSTCLWSLCLRMPSTRRRTPRRLRLARRQDGILRSLTAAGTTTPLTANGMTMLR